MWLHFRLWWRASPWLTIAMLLISIGDSLLLYLSIVVQAKLIDTVTTEPRWDKIWPNILLFVLILAAVPVRRCLHEIVQSQFQVKYFSQFQTLLAEAALAPHGIEELEDPQRSAELKALSSESRSWYSFYNIAMTAELIGYRLAGVAALIIVAKWNIWIALAVAAITIIAGHTFISYLKNIIDEFLNTSATSRQHSEYLRKLTTNQKAGKEVRLFGLTDIFVTRFSDSWLESLTQVWKNRNKKFIPSAIANVLAVLAIAIAITYIIHQGFNSVITLGTSIALIRAVIGLQGFDSMGDSQIHVARAESYATKLVELRIAAGLGGIPPREQQQQPSLAQPKASKAANICFQNVSFSYPGRKTKVFNGLNLEIPAGQHVAIVGVNGAGKSTLIKLMTGLYAPSSGSITIDGVDPRTSDEARCRVAVVFQDFIRYELSLRDNIALEVASNKDVEKALFDAAGESILARLDNNWDTILATGYSGGTDLSGGQWQRIALARAFAAANNGAGILALDEPTAALDIRAEAELFDRFLDATDGITSILISHRLSSVRNADRIIVIDAGRVIEDGTHEQLLSAQGIYATMFTTQAARFAQTGDIEDATTETTRG
ncbi:MAG: ABC transporter ATP-binding protein [Propionibacteriaceae bacterium]